MKDDGSSSFLIGRYHRRLELFREFSAVPFPAPTCRKIDSHEARSPGPVTCPASSFPALPQGNGEWATSTNPVVQILLRQS